MTTINASDAILHKLCFGFSIMVLGVHFESVTYTLIPADYEIRITSVYLCMTTTIARHGRTSTAESKRGAVPGGQTK